MYRKICDPKTGSCSVSAATRTIRPSKMTCETRSRVQAYQTLVVNGKFQSVHDGYIDTDPSPNTNLTTATTGEAIVGHATIAIDGKYANSLDDVCLLMKSSALGKLYTKSLPGPCRDRQCFRGKCGCGRPASRCGDPDISRTTARVLKIPVCWCSRRSGCRGQFCRPVCGILRWPNYRFLLAVRRGSNNARFLDVL